MTRSAGTDVKRVTVTLPRRQLDALTAIATREDVSLAWLVRKAVDRFIRDGLEIPIADAPKRSKALK
jgi:predicted DNA-binding ribbon-helix-helix protein